MITRFRKSVKLLKNSKLNIGKKGINSLSVKLFGLTFNIDNELGVSCTGSIPGTGISVKHKIK